MKIESVRIQRLRAIKDVTIAFNDYTCLVGPNGAGKSTVLCALNIFFRQTEDTGTNLQVLDREDFFRGETDQPIQVTLTFTDLSPQALERFQHYARGGKLIITAAASFNAETGRAEVKHYGERLGMAEFKPFFEAYQAGASAADIGALYDGLRQQFDLPKASSKDARREALWAYEAEHQDRCQAIPSEDQFYGVSKGANRLQEFVQWVYVPAIKDALTEQVEAKDTALGRLLARTVRARTNFTEDLAKLRADAKASYQGLLDRNQSALNEVSQSLSARLAEWSHPDASLKLEWQQDEKSVRLEEPWAHVKIAEGAFEGQLARLGHGLQRSYIIALLQELASLSGAGGPRLLLAIEEPELYQHPPQARHLAAILRTLGEQNAQVMVATHSPYFVSGEVFEDVRVVRRYSAEAGATVRWVSLGNAGKALEQATGKPFGTRDGVVARLQQTLQPALSEIFFASHVILVEGREDIAYLQTYLQLTERWDEFRKLGCHFVAADKKSEILRPLVIAEMTGIPVFVVFDADGDAKEQHLPLHEKDNKQLMRALGLGEETPFPEAILDGDRHTIWPTNLGKQVQSDVPAEIWADAGQEADKAFEQVGDLHKNVLHIAKRLEEIVTAGVQPQCLEAVAERLMAFGRSSGLSNDA